MKVLVTGATGFLGSFVVPRLIADGHDVVCLVRDPARAAPLGTTTVTADLDDAAGTAAAFEQTGAEVLVNLASLGFGHAPMIVEAAARSAVAHAVYVSTTAVTTALNAPSKQVRLAAEAAVKASTTPATIMRPTMIYGAPGDRNMERLLRVLARTPVFPLLGADGLHQPVHVDDLAAAVVRAATRPTTAGHTYDVAGPTPIPFREVVAAANRALGRNVRSVTISARPLLGVAALIERSGRRGPVSAEQINRLLEDKVFDITPARSDLGHDPRPFQVGITGEAEQLGLRR